LTPFLSEDRGVTPLLKNEQGVQEAVSWDKANEEFVLRFKKIIADHGPESVAFLSTGQIPFEEMALLGSVTKFGMGWVHGDGNTRQCMATAAVAYKQAFGFDAPPFTYQDFEESDLMVFVGSNPVINHPIMWNRVKKNSRNPLIVVVDPRSTETAKQAGAHFGIEPKTDIPFFYALARILIENDWIDHQFIADHTDGFEGFVDKVGQRSIADAAALCGIEEDRIYELARQIHEQRGRVSFWWTMGVNQSHQATRTAQALINLALITGNIGKPGTGANSITGQANAMGSRLFSNTTNLLGGHDFLNADHRKRVADRLGIPVEVIPTKNSMPYNQILEAARDGRIKGLWFIATNPGHSWINKTEFFDALKALDFLVVQDLYPTTETAVHADLFLPAAGSGEKSGTFINSERRLGVVQKVMDPPGLAKSDYDIFLGLANAWGCGDLFANWQNPEAAFRVLQRVAVGQPCDISGIEGYSMLLENNGVQWPYPQGNDEDIHSAHRRLFADGKFFTPSGRAQILFDDYVSPTEVPDEQYPTVLLTGRGTMMQFHTQTRTNKVPFIRSKTRFEGYVELHSKDAEILGVKTDDKVKVTSRRASVTVSAVVSDGVKPGQVFMPMHYQETNWLTYTAFDTYSFEPSYKYAAVKVEKA